MASERTAPRRWVEAEEASEGPRWGGGRGPTMNPFGAREQWEREAMYAEDEDTYAEDFEEEGEEPEEMEHAAAKKKEAEKYFVARAPGVDEYFLEASVDDDTSLNNPLERALRQSTGWFGVTVDFEGVIVDGCQEARMATWARLAEEEGKAAPPAWQTQRVGGMKAAQAVSEVFHWSRNPEEINRLALRAAEVFEAECVRLGTSPREPYPGLHPFFEALRRQGVPVAVNAVASRAEVEDVLGRAGLRDLVTVIVAGEDVARGKPDPDLYLVSAQDMGRPPHRCVAIGTQGCGIDAAKEVGMKFVGVTLDRPLHTLRNADICVNRLTDINVANLKSLFALQGDALPLQLRAADEEELYVDRA